MKEFFYNNLHHFTVIIIIFLISIIATCKIIFTDGLIIYGDFAIPTSLERFINLYYPLWNIYGSNPVFDSFSRIFSRGPSIFLAYLFSISIEILVKTMIVTTLFLSGISMYFAVYILVKSYKKNYGNIIFLASLIPALIYMFNPWSVFRVQHYSLWFGYALAPLTLISFMVTLQNPKLKYFIMTTLLWSLASTTPHYIMYLLLFFMSWMIYSLIFTKDSKFSKLLDYTKTTGLLLLFYIAFNAYWIIPILISSFTKVIAPYNVVTYEVVEMLSRNSDLLGVIRFLDSWWIMVNPTPSIYFLHIPWVISSFILPITAFAALFFKPKNKYILYFSLLTILFIFLGMGTKGVSSVYTWLVFDAPLIEIFGWIIRGPNKFGGLLVFTYSFLISFTILELSYRIKKIKWVNQSYYTILAIFLLIFISAFALYTGPTNIGFFGDKYVPVKVPQEFYTANKWLSNENDDFKVLWLPFYTGKETIWAPNKMIGIFEIRSSAKPTIGPFVPSTSYYISYIYSESLLNNKSSNFDKYIDFLNIRYMLFHNDIISDKKEGEVIIRNLNHQKDLKFIKQDGIISVFENPIYANHTNIPYQNIVVLNGLDKITSLNTIESFNPINTSLFFLDQTNLNKYNCILTSDAILIDKNFLELSLSFLEEKYVIKLFDATNHHNPSKMWSKVATNEPLDSPWHHYLEKRGIENWQSDYDKGLVFTWASSILNEPTSIDKDLIKSYDFENGTEDWNTEESRTEKLSISKNSFKGDYSLLMELYNSTWGWKTINSPFIEAKYGEVYRFELYIKAENAHAVHIKIIEYDENKKYLMDTRTSGGGDGSFDWEKNSFDFSPSNKNTSFIQLQIWHGHETKQLLPNKIWIDNVKIYNLTSYLQPNSLEIPLKIDKKDNYLFFIRYFQNEGGGEIKVFLDENQIDIPTYSQLNSFVWKDLGKFSLEKGDHKITLINSDGFNAVNLFALVLENEYEQKTQEIKDIVKDKRIIYVFEAETDLYRENATKSNIFGADASNGEVLVLSDNSSAFNYFEVLKPSKYRVAIRAEGSFSLKAGNFSKYFNTTNLDWFYMEPIYLSEGNHSIELKATNTSYLDVVWTYSTEKENETLEDIFTTNETPATILNYTKIGPTKYVVKVNSTKPYMLSFAESYDPLWVVYMDYNKDKTGSMPLYSVVNGFWINKTGEYELTIEYEPQRWFYIGSIITVTSIFISFSYLIYKWRRGGRT